MKLKNEKLNTEELFLNSLESIGSFTVPEKYFETLESKMFSKINETETEFLIEGNTGGFEVPENYCVALESTILLKTIYRQNSINIPLYANFRFKMTMGIAALFVFISLLFVFVKSTKPTEILSENEWNKLSDEELFSHVESSDLSAEFIHEIAFNNTKTKKPIESDEIEQYIIENSDEETLLEEL